jgi:hypothetical protein
MAFNPFHAFRRHQKTLFAALTIICMFTFVLSSGIQGKGDFLGEMSMLVGLRSRVPEAATLYGKKIEPFDFTLLREQRLVANQFMDAAISLAIDKIVQNALGPRSPLDQITKNTLQRVAQGWQQAMFQGLPPGFLEFQLSSIKEGLKDKPEQASLVGLFGLALQKSAQQTQRFFQTDELYKEKGRPLFFGGGTSAEALLDFMIWRHEADRLGIHLTPEDVRAEIEREALGSLSQGDINNLQRQLVSRRSSGPGIDIASALSDEFRVRLAQVAILGYDPGTLSHVPALVTPYEFWEFYRKNRTEASIRFLEIPVQHFVSQVKDKPTEDELKALHEEHKNEEYAPTKATPAFKLPRRIKVEWISASPESSYYQKAAQEWVLSAIASIPTSPLLVNAVVNYPVLREYSFQTQPGGQLRLPPWTEKNFALSLYSYAYWQQPQSAASLIGQIAGVVGTSGAPLANLDSRYTAALTTLAGKQASAVATQSDKLAAAVADVARSRIPMSGAFLAANPLVPPALNAMALGGLWNYASTAEQYVPLQVAKDQLLRRVEQGLASNLVNLSVTKFNQELETKRGQPAEAAKFVTDQIKQFGWNHGSSKEPRDRYDIANDPGLAQLKEGNESGSGLADDPKGKRFAGTLFSDSSSDQAKLYTPSEIFGNHATFVYWRTEDQPPKSLPFAEARAKVEDAWRHEKAKQLAKAEAEKIAKQAQDTKGDALRTLTEVSLPFGGKLMALDGISRLAKAPSPSAGMSARYSPFNVPEKVIEYPETDFVERVLGLKEKGDVLVLSNQPQDRYFVAALVERHEPTFSEFYADTNPGLQDFGGNELFGRFEQERRNQYREEVIKKLREQAQANLTDDAKTRQALEGRGSDASE